MFTRMHFACLITMLAVGFCLSPIGAQSNERGIDRLNFDTTYSPCDDFYQYANGTWLKNNPVPPEYGSWDAMNEVYERNQNTLHQILEEAAGDAAAPAGSIKRKIGDFYAVAMDSAMADRAGIEPLKADLAKIAGLASIADLRHLIAEYHSQGISMLFDLTAEQDMKNSAAIIAYVGQGGLGLPDRDYYTREDAESQELRQKYVEHISAMLMLLGDNETTARAAAQEIMELETQLAKASLTSVELRDPQAWYNMKTVAEADAMTPNFPWKEYFTAVGQTDVNSFSVVGPAFFTEANALMTAEKLPVWRNYLRWQLVKSVAPYLGTAFVNENFRFEGQLLQGSKENLPRWKRALGAINRSLGMALGQLYVEKVFPPKSKARADEMIANLKTSLGDRISGLVWMSQATKAKALEKLSAMTSKIGYPDKWRDYTALDIKRDSYVDNIRRARAFRMQYELAKIGKPVDRTEWFMNPQTVNAYYNPQMNEIVFPAGILQPPLFDGEIDDPINYGAMGAVIGHEMTHGFDDMGCQFDAQGNMTNWWTEQDQTEFNARTQKLVGQYGGYVAIDSLHINGQLTLGENIADLGGVLVAYYGLQKALAGKPETAIDGFTPNQRFFLSFAQVWRSNMRPETMKLRTNTDPHSPPRFRVLGTLANVPEFFRAFGCSDACGMAARAAEKVVIW
ncbi:MAG: M13 family metallopeptidase [candidate division Zixibacteria bacterium]|nr:M13 family metallopeptidase [candidate division Zixibacteria bacterium]